MTTVCDLLRVRTGFVANVAARTGPRLETSVGTSETIEEALSNFQSDIFVRAENNHNGDLFVSGGKFWYAPLKSQDREAYLGLLGIEARSDALDLSSYEASAVKILIEQAEFVLQDRRLQQNVFNALRGIVPEMERAQRLRSAVRYMGSPVDNLLTENNPVDEPDFFKMVHEALTHYWGGPKLSNSPLMQLQIVQKAVAAYDGDTVKGLRSVLNQAIENVRPGGERRMTASEWMLYNILELKFIQGLRVRDIARRLARSEADFYRKQKIAIKAVARSLSEMEKREQYNPPPESDPETTE